MCNAHHTVHIRTVRRAKQLLNAWCGTASRTVAFKPLAIAQALWIAPILLVVVGNTHACVGSTAAVVHGTNIGTIVALATYDRSPRHRPVSLLMME